MISNFLSNPLLQQYLNKNFAQPVDTGMPVQNKLYQQPYNMFDVSGGITNIPTNINQQPFDDYYGPNNIDTSFGVANEPDEEDEEQSFLNMITGGVQNISDKLGISSVIGAFNPLAGLVSKGIGAFSPSFVGPKGSRGYDSDTTLGLFARSNTLADFFQNVRDKKAREAAAARGAAKQAAIAASQQVDTGDSGAGSSFDAPSGGTFGSSVNDAGSFSDYS